MTAAIAERVNERENGREKEKRNVTINVRASAYVRDLIDFAASVTGKNRSEFMLESARAKAEDVLLDQRLFALDDKQYQRFVEILDEPAPPTDRLCELLARKAPWETLPK